MGNVALIQRTGGYELAVGITISMLAIIGSIAIAAVLSLNHWDRYDQQEISVAKYSLWESAVAHRQELAPALRDALADGKITCSEDRQLEQCEQLVAAQRLQAKLAATEDK